MYRRQHRRSPPRRRSNSPSYRRRSFSPKKNKSPYKWKYVQHPYKPHHDGWLLVKKKKSPSPKRDRKYYKPKAYLPNYYGSPPDARTAAKLLNAYRLLNAINSPTPTQSVILANWPNPIVPQTTTTFPIFPNIPNIQNIPSTTSPFSRNAAGKQTKLMVLRSATSSSSVVGPPLSTIPIKFIPGVTFSSATGTTISPSALYVYVVDGPNVDQAAVTQLKTNAKGRFIVINLIPYSTSSPIVPLQITDPDLNNIQRPLYYDPTLASNPSTQQQSWYDASVLPQNLQAYQLIRDLSFAAIV